MPRYVMSRPYRPGTPMYKIEDRGFTSSCWIWVRGLKDGYGSLSISKHERIPAHRYFYEKYKGPIPEGLQIDHLCRQAACVNPDHLEAVTIKTNVRRGNATLLTQEEVNKIREMHEKGIFGKVIAEHFKVSQATISMILNNHYWK